MEEKKGTGEEDHQLGCRGRMGGTGRGVHGAVRRGGKSARAMHRDYQAALRTGWRDLRRPVRDEGRSCLRQPLGEDGKQ